MVCRCARAVHTWILSAWMVLRLLLTVCALSVSVQRVGAQTVSLLMLTVVRASIAEWLT